MRILVCFDVYIYFGGSKWHSEISFILWKSDFGSIKRCCKSNRASKIWCLWFVVMNNILNSGSVNLGVCIHLFPDGISIIDILSNGISSSTRIFWGDAVDFELFINRVIPIKVRIWIFGYRVVLWVKIILGFYRIIVSLYIYMSVGT